MARNHKIQLRRDTAANWTSADPTLAAGELGLETDTGKVKAGDGATAWSSLDPINTGAYAPDTIVRAAAGLDNIVAYDTFNRDDGALGTSDSGHTWTVSSGPAAIASNKLSCSSISLAWIDPGEANHDVSLRVDPWGGTNAGLLIRGVDASNFLFFDLQSTVAVLRKVVAGAFSNLSSVAAPHTSGDVVPIRVVARGSRIQCFRDGHRLIDHTLTGGDETTFASSTKVGIRANATFDDLVVRGA